MRLLYVCSDFGIPPSGTKGASIHLRAITGALCDLGHEVLLLSPKKGPDDPHPVRPLLSQERSPEDRTSRLLKRWLQDRGLEDSVARELRPLIYNASIHEPASESLADRRPDAILERLSLFGHVGIDLADSLGVPLVVEVNAPLTDEARRFRSLQLSDLARQIERRVLARADALLAVSKPLAQWLTENEVSPDKVHVVVNGVDVARFEAAPSREDCRAKLGLTDEFCVGFVGSLKDWHGVDVLLGAFRLLLRDDPSARLLIVGSGPAEARLRRAAVEMEMADSVHFTGAVPHDRVPELLGAMDVAVAPFRHQDCFYFSPIKVFEYMACGACVVASRLGQIAEVIEDGVNGLLCAPDDERDLLAALTRARKSPDLRRRLGTAALHTVRDRYTWARAAEETSRVIQSVIDTRRDRLDQPVAGIGAGSSDREE